MIDGIILIDKPPAITTFDIIRKLRKILNIKKMGHAGVLDKMATGLVIVGVGKATKLLSIFENAYKVYEAEFTFGIRTDTYDLDGRILQKTKVDSIDRDKLIEIIESLKGAIEQEPPPFSNVKVRGKRLYKYALKNQDVVRPKRKVTIHEFKLLNIKENKALFLIKCSKGTYIRSLANEVGERLGCGGIVSRLRRIYIYPFSVDEASRMDNPIVIPTNKALRFIDEIIVEDSKISNIKNGVTICSLLDCSKLRGKYYRLVNTHSQLIAVIEKSDSRYLYKVIF